MEHQSKIFDNAFLWGNGLNVFRKQNYFNTYLQGQLL